MRFRLSTLLIVLAVLPPVLASAWFFPGHLVEAYRWYQLNPYIDAATTFNITDIDYPPNKSSQ